MAAVQDLSGNFSNSIIKVTGSTVPGMTDRKLARTNRANAGSPVGSLTPLYVGEIVNDTTNRLSWSAIGPTNNDWQTVYLNAS